MSPLFDCHQVVGTVTGKAGGARNPELVPGIPVVAGGLECSVLHPGEPV